EPQLDVHRTVGVEIPEDDLEPEPDPGRYAAGAERLRGRTHLGHAGVVRDLLAHAQRAIDGQLAAKRGAQAAHVDVAAGKRIARPGGGARGRGHAVVDGHRSDVAGAWRAAPLP